MLTAESSLLDLANYLAGVVHLEQVVLVELEQLDANLVEDRPSFIGDEVQVVVAEIDGDEVEEDRDDPVGREQAD